MIKNLKKIKNHLYIRVMGNFVYQGDEDSCGLAALKMLLLELTKKKGYRYMTADEKSPLSLEDIRLIALKEGVDIRWKRCKEKEDLISCQDFPLLAVLESNGKQHLVLLKKASKRKILVYDPSSGPKWIKKEKLAECFSGVYGDPCLFSKENCPYSKPKIFKKCDFALVAAVTLVGIAFLYAGLTFMGGENIYFAILFLSIYGFCSIVSRFLNGRYSNEFDKKWLRYVTSPTKKRFIKNYERYYAFKSETFPAFINVFECVSVIFGLNFLYGLNDPCFFIAAIGLSLYLVIESKLYRRGINEKKEELSIDEIVLLECKDSQADQLEKMRKIGRKANQIGTSLTYSRIIYFAVAVGLAFIAPFINNNLSLNYYLFHLFGLLAIGQGIRSLLCFFETKSSREKAYFYFLETFVRKETSR